LGTNAATWARLLAYVTGLVNQELLGPNAKPELASGWPIASGPVEGACKNLIKDRMDRSGMRWTEQMAEAVVQQLRAIDPSDIDVYWEFHIEQDQRRLYTGWTRRSKVATTY
jgi:hypothetical protein